MFWKLKTCFPNKLPIALEVVINYYLSKLSGKVSVITLILTSSNLKRILKNCQHFNTIGNIESLKMSKRNWSMALLRDMNDPTNQIISNDIGIVMKDKYPKAMHHYLVLAKEDIPSIYYLKPTHLPLLDELYLLGINVIEIKKLRKESFKFGFHVHPSMQRLHMHVISNDFVSPCLKTKKHWNSFNTKLFLPFNELIDDLKKNGQILRMDKEQSKEQQKELKCNQCSYIFQTMPDLKTHLLTHLSKI